MEPLFFKAENVNQPSEQNACVKASMEPLFFKAENAFRAGSAPGRARLQWSRFFSKRKTRDIRDNVWSAWCFNGAAFFQSGKQPATSGELTAHDKLQWSRFFSKRKSRPESASARSPDGASMEPLFFKAENLLANLTHTSCSSASMEPLFFKAEKKSTNGRRA